MVREFSIVSDPVMLHVWSCLHNYAYEDALFAAERLYAETNSSESLYLLATSLYRIGRPKQVSRLLNSVQPLTQKSRFLLSKCYFDFGLLTEAEEALLGPSLSQKSLDDITSAYEEQASYALLLLGDINRRQGRITEAAKSYKKCLELNPLLWTAFKNLCSIGEYPNPSIIFQIPDGFSLPTPTYKVLEQVSEVVGNHDDYNSLFERAQKNKEKIETICSRENVNPEKTETVRYNVTPIGLLQEKPLLEATDNSLIHRTYLAHCAKNSVLNTSGVSEHIDFMQTPQTNVPIAMDLKAPRAEQNTRTVGRLLFSDNASGTDLPTPVSPRFGALALLSQSPMFACVPVFHKPTGFSAACDSILSNSMRFGNNQCAPLRQAALNESTSVSISQNRNQIDNPVGSTISRFRSKPVESELSNLNSRNSHLSSVIQASRVITEHTTTSTPAHTASSLRRLVISTSPNTTSLMTEGLTTVSISHSNSLQLREAPSLRSSGQRTVSLASNNVLTPRVSVPMLNVNSPTGASVSSSSTPRASPQGTLRRFSGDSVVPEDNQFTGPRTRSQVAAAAAVARASGIQRRSTRIVRGKAVVRKPDNNPADPQNPTDITCARSSADDTHSVPDELRKNPVTFGSIIQDKEVVSIDIPVSNKDDRRVRSLRNYLELLSSLGKAYQLLTQHQWKHATRLLAKLPPTQLATGRVLSWAACAHMDNADYITAHKLFSEARRLEPWQLCGMDFYSTVLWQLQADSKLAELAQDLLELDRNAPEPWCVAGNCFSLQGEHETAIQFFRRGLQVCPTSAYTYTLLGHEHSVLEEFDRALISFRYALRLDPRQYNALFGISNVYYRQEKFELAETHLARAVALFSHSPLLLTNLGALRGRLGRLDDGPGSALHLVTLACKLQPKNPLARYHRASILFHLGRYVEVLNELQQLLVLTPREAMVYLMIGHTYKKLGNTPQAMIHYSWAMGLDPKGANTHLRDIMTNPPVAANRNATRRTATGQDVHGSGNTPSARPDRVTRSRVMAMPDTLTPTNTVGARVSGDGIVVDDNIDDDDELDVDGEGVSDGLVDTDALPDVDGIASGVGLLNTTHITGSASSRVNGVRYLTDFSLLYDTEEYDEDAALSGAEDDHYETMELSGDVDEMIGGPSHSDA